MKQGSPNHCWIKSGYTIDRYINNRGYRARRIIDKDGEVIFDHPAAGAYDVEMDKIEDLGIYSE